MGNKPLKHNYPRVYNVCFDKNKNFSVADVFLKGIDNILFIRTLWGSPLELMNHIIDACVLNEQEDTIRWALNKKMMFILQILL